jgi:outer membrane PBP1 activator LpoA protein
MRLSFLFLLSSLLLSACVSLPELPGGAPAGTLPAEAKSLEQKGRLRQAAEKYREAAALSPAPEAAGYLLDAARLLYASQAHAEAAKVMAGIDAGKLAKGRSVERAVLAARIHLALAQPEQALRQLSGIGRQVSTQQWITITQLRAQALAALGDIAGAARNLVDLSPYITDPQRQADNRRAIWEMLSTLTATDLTNLRAGGMEGALSGWLDLLHVIRANLTDVDALEAALAAWRLRHPAHDADGPFLQSLLGELMKDIRYPQQVALLLPLSGRLAVAGNAVREGFLAAHYARHGHGGGPVLRIYDVGDGGPRAARVYVRAVDEGADLIVGPLDKQGIEMLGESLTVPVLALNRTDTSDTTEGLTQFGLAPEDEARQVAERAFADGLNKAVVIAPRSGWGDRIVNAFSQRLQELGGEVLADSRYRSGTSDFGGSLQHLLNIDASKERRNRLRRLLNRRVEFEPRRRQDVDFVFMAALPRQARLIAPQLDFFQAGDLPLYATSHVYTGNVDKQADQDMAGVVFCDLPWVLDEEHPPEIKTLLERLRPDEMKRYTRFFALGVDAHGLIPYLGYLRANPGAHYTGVTGELSMDAQGRIHRGLNWARFAKGEPRMIAGPLHPVQEQADETQQAASPDARADGGESSLPLPETPGPEADDT